MNAPRYFTDGEMIWKFEDGKKTQMRLKETDKWQQSVFNGLAFFIKSEPNIVEINHESGEP